MKDETVQQESRIKILFSQSNSCVYLCVVFPGPGPSNQHSQRRNKLVTNIRQHITKSDKKNRYRGQFDIHDQYLIVPFVKKMYRSLIVIYFVQKQSFHRNISNFVNELGTEGFRTGFFGSPCSFTSEEMAVLGSRLLLYQISSSLHYLLHIRLCCNGASCKLTLRSSLIFPTLSTAQRQKSQQYMFAL